MQWKKEKELLEKKLQIKQEKRALKNKYLQLTTTKLLILFLFISCTVIELFTGWITIKSISLAMITGLPPDFSPLVTLIGAVIGEVFGFAVYALKSAKENTKDGIVYLQAQQNINQETKG